MTEQTENTTVSITTEEVGVVNQITIRDIVKDAFGLVGLDTQFEELTEVLNNKAVPTGIEFDTLSIDEQIHFSRRALRMYAINKPYNTFDMRQVVGDDMPIGVEDFKVLVEAFAGMMKRAEDVYAGREQ